MAQNTSSAAYLQLKPLENTDLGSIVEENIRYWKQTRDAEEAERLASEARQAEYMRKVRNDRKGETVALSVGDAQGKFRNQRVELLEKVAPEYAQLKQQYAETGDRSLLTQMDGIRSYFDELNSITKNVESYSAYLVENKDADFNSDLDKGKKEKFQKLTSGVYSLDKKKGFGIPNENGEITEWISPSRLNEEFSTLMKFSGKPKFDEMGTLVAKNVAIPKVDGEQRNTKDIEKAGISLIKNILLEDDLKLRSVATRLGKDPSKELTEADMTQLSSYLYSEYVDSKIQEVVNPLGMAQKKQSLSNSQLEAQNKVLAIKKAKKEQDALPNSNIGIAKDIDGTSPLPRNKENEQFFVKGDVSYDYVQGDKNTRFTLDGIEIRDGKPYFVGTTRERIAKTNTDGDITGYVDGVVINSEPTDIFTKNKIADMIVVDGERPSNFADIPRFLQKVRDMENGGNQSDNGILD